MPAPPYQAKTEFFGMFGHPVRIRVLELLQDAPKPVRDLLAETGIETSSLSQQLGGPAPHGHRHHHPPRHPGGECHTSARCLGLNGVIEYLTV